MSDILNEPACIPCIPPLNKEAAKSKPDMPQDHQDFPLPSAYLYVTERDLGLLGQTAALSFDWCYWLWRVE